MRDKLLTRKISAIVVSVALALGVIGLSEVTRTSAQVTDSATATSGELAAGDVLPAVSSVGCTSALLVATLTWPHVGFGFEYRVEIVNSSGRLVRAWDIEHDADWSQGSEITRPFSLALNQGLLTDNNQARIYTRNPSTDEYSDEWTGRTVNSILLGTAIGCGGQISGEEEPLESNFAAAEAIDGAADAMDEKLVNEPFVEDGPALDDATMPADPSTSPRTSTSAESSAPTSTAAASGTTTPTTTVPRSTSTTRSDSATRSTSSGANTTRSTTTSETSTPTTSVTTPARAEVGEDPIAVGTSYARLDEADGEVQLIVSAASGTEICSAEVPGATRIESSGGTLTVTGEGRTRSVDTATCAIA